MNMNNKISRRSALKRMGTAVISGAAAASGLLPLVSCSGGKNKRIIFYFTGTGNCLYIARQLAGEETELLSIPRMVKQGKYEFEADEIGIVYPIYGHMPPNMVREFIKKARLKAGYKFAVLTYGARKCNAVEIWDRISRSAGNAFDYIGTIIMVDNWLPNFDMNEQIRIDKHIPENLQKITADIGMRRRWHEPVTEDERQQHRSFMAWAGLDPEKGYLLKSEQSFTVTDSRWLRFYKGNSGKRPVSLLAVSYEGLLEVTDAQLFKKTLTEGMGRGKAFGLGLLTVVRAGD